jgi:hypothetical protein
VGVLATFHVFVERVRIGEDHPSQLSFGDGALIVGDVRHDRHPPRQGEETHAVMVRHRWTFSQTLRDVAPEEWGGTAQVGK